MNRGNWDIQIDKPGADESISIFNTFRFFELHRNSGSHYLRVIEKNSAKILGVFHGSKDEGGVYKSPARGTFGGFEIFCREVDFIESFVGAVDEHIGAQQCAEAFIAERPLCYDEQAGTLVQNALVAHGYTVRYADIDHFIPIDPSPLIDKMEHNNQKRFRKCLRDGFAARRASPDEFRTVYDVIAENRRSKGYPISMTYRQIDEMVQVFPNDMHFFAAHRDGTIVAGSICLKVSQDVLYVFYWGDLPGHETYSPVTVLADTIYRFAQMNGFRILDLGTSTLQGSPNEGLGRFKKNLGAKETPKITYSKKFR